MESSLWAAPDAFRLIAAVPAIIPYLIPTPCNSLISSFFTRIHLQWAPPLPRAWDPSLSLCRALLHKSKFLVRICCSFSVQMALLSPTHPLTNRLWTQKQELASFILYFTTNCEELGQEVGFRGRQCIGTHWRSHFM